MGFDYRNVRQRYGYNSFSVGMREDSLLFSSPPCPRVCLHLTVLFPRSDQRLCRKRLVRFSVYVKFSHIEAVFTQVSCSLPLTPAIQKSPFLGSPGPVQIRFCMKLFLGIKSMLIQFIWVSYPTTWQNHHRPLPWHKPVYDGSTFLFLCCHIVGFRRTPQKQSRRNFSVGGLYNEPWAYSRSSW